MPTEHSTLTESVPEHLVRDNKMQIQFRDGSTDEPLSSEISVKVDNPYRIDLNPFVPKDQIYLLEDFYESLQTVLDNIQDREGTVVDQRISIIQEYPAEPFAYQGDSVITFKVLKREPAKMDAKGTGRPNRGWGFPVNFSPASNPNKVIIIESRPIDHSIELAVWAKTATIANEKALWLERNLIRETWAFKIKGVDRFIWEERGADTVWTPSQTRIHQRPLRFKVRLYEFMPRAHSQIKDISFSVRNKLI
jgi:hypothetical protein